MGGPAPWSSPSLEAFLDDLPVSERTAALGATVALQRLAELDPVVLRVPGGAADA